MAAKYGRTVKFTWGGVVVPGAQSDDLEFVGEPSDITDKGDDGYQTFMTEDARLGVNVSTTGPLKSNVLREAKATGDLVKAGVITYADGKTVEGDFVLFAYSESHPEGEPSTFSATFNSTGSYETGVVSV